MATNASVQTSMLNKSHNAVCYHRVRESQATGKIRVGWIEEKRNLVYLLKKTNMDGNACHPIVEIIFHYKTLK